MNHSVYTVFIFLSVVFFLQVDCGKDPMKRQILASKSSDDISDTENMVEVTGKNLETIVSGVESEKVERLPLESKNNGVRLKTVNDTTATFSITVSGDGFLEEGENEESGIDADEHQKDVSTVAKPRPGIAYLTQLQGLLSQFLTFIGLRSHVERKHRGLDFDSDNEIMNYRDGLRTTMGAVMGKSECIRKATCRAGKYLKTVKGKEIVIVLLEKLTPSSWTETLRLLKNSTIYNDQCDYNCLE